MKRVIGFLSILLVVLIGYYLQPILFPPTQKTVKIQQNQVTKHKALKHQTIKTEGYAQYISQPVETFEQQYGQPIKIEESGFFFQTRQYAIDQGILEVNVEEGKISGIKLMAKNATVSPFHFGMTSNQLADQLNLSADFALTYDEEPVEIELSENDMRYRPLVAFDNGSFALLFFNAKSEKLIGLVYLNIENLLRLMPYQINSGNPLANRVQESNLDWNVLNQQKQTRLIEEINRYRSLWKQAPLTTPEKTMADSKKMLKSFLSAPEKVLSQERQEEWQTDQEAHLSNRSFELTAGELEELSELDPIDYQHGMLYSPMIDPLFSLLNWLSRDHLNDLFDDSNAKENGLGVAIDQESVLVLLQETEKTKDSE